MTYRRPGIQLTQEFVEALPALAQQALPNVNIGPVFQIVANDSVGAYEGVETSYSYLSKTVGNEVDIRDPDDSDLLDYPVRIFLRSVSILYHTLVSTGLIETGALTILKDNTTDVFADVVAGDIIKIEGSGVGNDGEYIVREKISNQILKLRQSLASAENPVNYSVIRNLATVGDGIEIARTLAGVTVDASAVVLPDALTYGDTYPKLILSADVYLRYRALTDAYSADTHDFADITALLEEFALDQIVPQNVAVYAVSFGLQNTVSPCNLLGLRKSYLTNEVSAHQSALDVLKTTTMYALNVLSQNPSVHQLYPTHVTGLSSAAKKKWRIAFLNRKLLTVTQITDTVNTSGSGNGFVDATHFVDANAEFVAAGVVQGMFLTISSPVELAGRYEIAGALSDTELLLSAAVPAYTVPVLATTYVVDKDMSKTEQAEYIANYSASFANRRIVCTWPDVVRAPVGSPVVDLPGFFLGSAIAAMVTGLAPHQGFTSLTVSGFVGTQHCYPYFDDDQLDTIAAGGTLICVQEIPETALFIRHQLTSDRSSIKTQELSITKNLDSISYIIVDAWKGYIGKYNIVDGTIDEIKQSAGALIKYFKEDTKMDKIGGMIRSGTLTQLVESDVNIDTLIAKFSFDLPMPLNNIEITVQV